MAADVVIRSFGMGMRIATTSLRTGFAMTKRNEHYRKKDTGHNQDA